MKNLTLMIGLLVLFAISGCSVRPMVVRHQRYSGKTGAMEKDGRNSIAVAPTGYILLFESPIDYALNPTVGNGHLRRCIRKEANKLAKADNRQSVVNELRYHPEFTEDRKAIVATFEPGRIGVEVLDDGMEVYADFHEFTETHAEHACEEFRQLIKVAEQAMYGDTRMARNDRAAPETTTPDLDDADSEAEVEAEVDEDPKAEADDEAEAEDEAEDEDEDEPEASDFEEEE